jgi:hypothetical protein
MEARVLKCHGLGLIIEFERAKKWARVVARSASRVYVKRIRIEQLDLCSDPFEYPKGIAQAAERFLNPRMGVAVVEEEAQSVLRAIISEQEKPQQEKPQQEKPQQEKPQQEKPQQEKPQQEKPQQEKPQQAGNIQVNGTYYRSVYAAFVALDLPVNKHQRFRAEFNKGVSDTFTHDGASFTFRRAR